MSGCRIGRVRFRNGTVVIPFRSEARDDVQKRMSASASEVLENYRPGELDGFFMVAWDDGGYYSAAWHLEGAAIDKTLLPSWLGDVARRSLIATGEWD